MIVKSVNNSWAIPDSMVERYGKTWANIDFEVNPRLSNYALYNDPMNTIVGQLCLNGKKLDASMKQLRTLKTVLEHVLVDIKLLHGNTNSSIDVPVLNNTFYLKSREITRLYETIEDSINTINKSYKLGLYL
jgi:hypothetical protein